MLAGQRLASNKFLEGIVNRFGAEAVEHGAIHGLGYPATLIGSASEAITIKQFLENESE